MRRILLSPGPVLLVWLGVVIGISFIEGPVKFSAPTLTREVALDVGRVVFTALNRTELVLFALTVLLGYTARANRLFWTGLAVLATMLALQTLWLLPALAARAEMIVGGTEPPASIAHAAYATIEVAKVVLLALLGLHSLAAAGEPRG